MQTTTNASRHPPLSDQNLAVLRSQNPSPEDLPFQKRILAELLQTVPAESQASIIQRTMLRYKAMKPASAAENEARFRLLATNAIAPRLQRKQHVSRKMLESMQESQRRQSIRQVLKNQLKQNSRVTA